MRKIFLLLVIVTIFASGAIFLQKSDTSSSKLTNTEKLEQFLTQNNATPEIAKAYRFAKDNPQGVLSKVRCYCGCLKNQGHKNNRDCFFNEDGSFDLMGLNCGLCVKTALSSKQMLAEGKTVQEISNYVDSRWGKSM